MVDRDGALLIDASVLGGSQMPSRGLRQAILIVVGVLLAFGFALTQVSAQSQASSVRAKFRSGNEVVIPASETVTHDLYIAAGTVRVDGRIDGDLFVAGGTIDVTGPVTGDLFVAGGTITLSGEVGRHLRVAGGNVSIASPVQLDLLAGAGTLTLASPSRVSGDLIFSAGQMTLDGTVTGSVLGSTGSYTKRGTVGGVEEVEISTTQTAPPPPAPTVGGTVLHHLQRYIGMLAAGGLLLWLTPRLVRAAAARITERPLPTIGIGALGFVGFFPLLLALFIAMIFAAIGLGLLGMGRLIAVTVFGVLIGSASLSFVFVLVLLFVAAAVVGLAVGQFALDRAGTMSAQGPFVALMLGALAIVLLTAIPIVGWVLNAVVVLFGLGALLAAAWRLRRPATPPATTV